MQHIVLTTRRLKIRNLEESDLEAFYAYRSDPEITRYQGFDRFSREQALSFIQDNRQKIYGVPGEWIQYAIENQISRQLIGDCAICLKKEDVSIAELGITISTAYQRQGFAKESLTGLMQFLFEEKNIAMILERVDAENTASCQLMRSLSFRQEGSHIENIFFKGRWTSEYEYLMPAAEWRRMNGS